MYYEFGNTTFIDNVQNFGCLKTTFNNIYVISCSLISGADPGFQVKKIAPKIFWVFRVKNHDFTPNNLIFSNFREGVGCTPPPLDPPLNMSYCRDSSKILIVERIKIDTIIHKYMTAQFQVTL